MTFFQGQTQEERFANSPTGAPAGPGMVANQNLARRIKLAQDAAPMLGQGEGVKIAMQLAGSSFDDNELVRQATSIASDALVRGYVDHLKSIEDPWKQLQAFNGFDPGQQKLIRMTGYVPPNAEEPDITEFGIVKKIAGDFLHDVTSIPGIKQGLHQLNVAGALGTHLYRTARLGGAEEGLFEHGGSLPEEEIKRRHQTPAAIWRDFQDLWGRTREGEAYFSEKSKKRVEEAMGNDDDKYGFVNAMAKGQTISDYLINDLKITPDTPYFDQQLTKYSQYAGQEEIQSAVKDLRNNKVSPGRDFARVFTPFRDGTAPFNVVSGGIDGTYRVLTDPTLQAGAALKTARVAQFGLEAKSVAAAAEGLDSVQFARRVDYLSNLPRFQRAADAIAEGLNSGRIGDLLDQLPQLRGGGLHDMGQYFAKKGEALADNLTRDDIFEYFKSTAGAKALNEGKFAAAHFPGTTLPSLARDRISVLGADVMLPTKGNLVTGMKSWVSQFRLEDYGFDALEPDQLKELFNLRQRTAIDLRQGVGNAIHSMYTLVPKYDYMGPDDSHSLNQFRAVLEYSLPGQLRDDYLTQWLATTDVGVRRSIYESGVQAMFHYSGALQTDEGKTLLNKILGRTQTYAPDAIDQLGGRSIGIGEADIAEYWGIPDFKEMLQATGDTTRLRKILDGTNEGMVNRFMATYWKPAVLLKAGFVPRAFGEEFLGFILREGPSAWLKSQAAITATREGYILPMRPVGWIADSLLGHIPLISTHTPAEIFAHNLADSVSTFTRNWAERLAPEEYIRGLRHAAMYGDGLEGAVNQLGTSLGEVSTPIGQRLMNETVGRVDPATKDLTYVPVRHGEITTHIRGPAMSGFYPHTVLREMRRIASDRVYAGAVDAGRRQLLREEAEGIVNLFDDAGLIPRPAGTPVFHGTAEPFERFAEGGANFAGNKIGTAEIDSLLGPMVSESAEGARTYARRAAEWRGIGGEGTVLEGRLPEGRYYESSGINQNVEDIFEHAIDQGRITPEAIGRDLEDRAQELERQADAIDPIDEEDEYDIAAHRRQANQLRDEARHYAENPDAFREAAHEHLRRMADQDPEFAKLIATEYRKKLQGQGYIGIRSGGGTSYNLFDTSGMTLAPEGQYVAPRSIRYTEDLMKIRELIPDEVMPNFERWLRNDSHASIAAVLGDLTEAGMDLDSAKAVRDAIEQLDNRQRVALFTRDGEIEKIYRPHILDPNAAFDVNSDLPQIRQHVEDEARKEYDDVLRSLWDEGESSHDAYWKITRRRLNSADMSETVRKSYRSTRTLDGRTVAEPPVKGTRRVYTVVMDKDPVSAFEEVGSTMPVNSARALDSGTPKLARTNDIIDADNGYIPFQTVEVNGTMVPNYQPNMEKLADLPEGESLAPDEMAWFTQDYAHAADIHDGLKAKYQTQPVSIAYVDVPEDIFQEGQRLAKANISGGLDPMAQAKAANQIWVPKSWRENYKVLGDDNFQMIDGVPAVGAARHEAIDDWAEVAVRRYVRAFESKDPHALRELQHKLLENRINVNDVFEQAPYLADSAIGPAVLEPSRDNWFKNLIQRGFDAIGAGGNAMVRNQMYLHYYTQRLERETEVMTRLLSAHGTADTIKNYSDRLGVTHFQLASDWNALSPEVRNSVDPIKAAIARDPVPPSLRTITDPKDQRQFAEAFTAWYEHQNEDLLPEVEKLWQDKYIKGEGVTGYSFNDLQDSYISLDPELRHSIIDNGYPPDLPPAFKGADLNADEWTELRDALDKNKEVYRTAHQKAMKGAIEDTIPWIDDHRIRSQFQQHGRNLIPFWFAQENFIKRTFNNLARDPAAIRKAQIMMDALHNSGFVTQNQFGEDVFNIPFTGAITSAITNGLEKITGGRFKVSFPTVNPMTGQVKYVIPGLDSLDRIGPSVSPVVGLPLEAITRIFPELNGAKKALVGDRGVTDDNAVDLILKSIMPSWASKMYESMAKDVTSDSEYASAMIQTSQMLQVKTEQIMAEAKGLDPVNDAAKIKEIRDKANKYGLTEDADEYEQKDYRHRLENFTRMQMFLRGAVGFFSPAAPSTAPIDEFTPEFNKLLHEDGLPLGEAFDEFMARHPDARAYTIVKTDVPSKAPLSSSEEAGLILNRNKDYFEKYSMAGPWLLPQSDDKTGFSYQTYNDEIGMELRQRKTVKEWYDDYFFAAAADQYFNNKDDYELRMAAAKGNSQLRAQYTQQFQTWKEQYLGEHKVFARLLNDPQAQQRRREVIDQMDDALNDPAAPNAAHKDQLRTLVDNYKSYQDSKGQYKRNTNAERQIKQNMTDRFTIWVRQYVDKNPEVKAFYNRIIRPELGID